MAAPAPPQPRANGQASAPASAVPPAPVDAPLELLVELYELALQTDAGQRLWRFWCRTTPAVVALGQIAVRVNPGGLTVTAATEQGRASG